MQIRLQYFKVIKEKKQIYRQSFYDTLLRNRNDSKKFWSAIKRVRPRESNQITITLDEWREHFEGVLGQCSMTTNTDVGEVRDEQLDDICIEDLDEDITVLEVKRAIKMLKPNKSPGLDDITSEFIKSAEPIISPFLVKLFNQIYDTGTFPQEWGKSIIIPLFKSGDKNNPGNYRGISLLSILSKVFTSILNNRLYRWAENNHKICPEQAGFRQNYGTCDQIFTLISMIKKSAFGCKKGKLYVAFIDYLKAFDSVDRESLWLVLTKIKTSAKMLRMLQGIYSSVQACVKWGLEASSFFDCPVGVKQGCMLSPLIFSLFVNDVSEFVTKHGKHGVQLLPGLQEIFLLLFADDICLISTTPAGLQNQLNNLEKASSSLGLMVNLKKTKIMVFRRGGHLAKSEKWYYQGKEIEIVNSYKYLGFTLTTKLSFEIALEELAGRAKAGVVEIMKIMWSLGHMDLSVFFKLFDCQVKPLLLYSAEIWGLTRFHIIESVHLFACKRFLNVSSRTPNLMIYGELGRYPLYIDSALKSVKYWFKLQNLLLARYPKQAYEMEKKIITRNNEQDSTNWAYNIKRCFDLYGFSEVWLNGGVGNVSAFLRVLKQRMIDCYMQDWNNKLYNSDRYSTYRSFKSLFCRERYLNDITLTKFRNIFVRFRLGIIDININKRYAAENVSKLCPFCSYTEDELHVLLYCKKYTDLRERFLSKLCISVHQSSLLFLLQNENPVVTRSVAMFVHYALKRRLESLHV